MKPISSETSNAERWSGANYGSIGDSWPVAFTSQTTVTLTGAATGATTKNLLLQCYDNSSPGNSIQPAGWTVDASSFNIVVTFASSQTGYCVVNSSGGGGGGGVTSFSGDGTFLTNSSSTGAVTATLGTAGAHKWWGNSSGSTGIPGYNSITAADLPAALSSSTSVNGASIPASATLAQTICNGTITLPTSSISSGGKSGASASAPLTTTCTELATSDNIKLDFASDPSGVTGYAPSANGTLTIVAWPTANTINLYVYNNTGSSVTPGSMTVNYHVWR